MDWTSNRSVSYMETPFWGTLETKTLNSSQPVGNKIRTDGKHRSSLTQLYHRDFGKGELFQKSEHWAKPSGYVFGREPVGMLGRALRYWLSCSPGHCTLPPAASSVSHCLPSPAASQLSLAAELAGASSTHRVRPCMPPPPLCSPILLPGTRCMKYLQLGFSPSISHNLTINHEPAHRTSYPTICY